MPPTASPALRPPAPPHPQLDRAAALAAMAGRARFQVTETVITETAFGLEVLMTGDGKMIFEVLDA